MGAFDDLIPDGQSGDPFADVGADPGFKPGDYLLGLKRGVQQIPGALTGLADIPGALLTGERYADKLTDKAGALSGFRPGQWAKDTQELLSPGAKESMRQLDTAWKRSGADRLGDALLGNFSDLPDAWHEADLTAAGKAIVENPGAAAMNVVESLPAMVAGGAIGKGLAVGAKLAPVLAGAAGEGLITAGQQMDQTDANVDPRKAAGTALAAGAGTALLAGMGGKVAQKLGLEDVQTAMAGGRPDATGRGALARVGGGAVSEGLLQELPQSMQEQAWQNYAEDKPLGEGVIRQGVEGAIAGGVMGGGANLRPAPHQPAIVPRQDGMGSIEIDPTTGPLSAAAAAHVKEQQAQATTGDLFGDLVPGDLFLGAPETPDLFADLVPTESPSPLQAWQQEAEPVTLAEAQGIVQQSRAAGYGGHAVIQHGAGYGVVPREWLTADQVKASEAFQPSTSGVLNQSEISTPAATVDQAASVANTEPTEEQQTAGNYRKGHIKVGPLDIAIENPAGSTRTGPGWATTMKDHYGYVKRTEGADSDQVDVYVKAGTPTDHAGPVFVIDQYDPTTGKFDETKAMVGYRFKGAAIKAYDAHFSDGSGLTRRQGVTKMSAEQFKQWAQSAAAKAPASTPRGWEGFQAGDRVSTKAGTTGVLHFDDTRTVAYVTPDKLAGGIANPNAGETTAKAKGTFSVSPAEVSKAPPVSPAKVENFGEHIGGSRADRWRLRGLSVEDLTEMSATEAAGYVTKDAVWPKPDYAKLISEGMAPHAVALLKQIRDRMTVSPRKDTEEGRRDYVEAVSLVREAAKTIKTEEDVKALAGKINRALNIPDSLGLVEREKPEIKAALNKLWSIYKGRSSPLNVSWTDQRKAKQMIAEGWPATKKPATKAERDSRELPNRPHLDNLQRTGQDVRNGKDITPQRLVEDFGFRGIEFGHWAANDERQKSINLAYEALHDLAGVLNVPPRALSLNGTLGLAFGARGGGRHAAHYEPGKLVINITKLNGAGSLAHEFGHALDHYLGELDRSNAYGGKARGASGWMNTNRDLKNLRPELAAAFDKVMTALFNRDRTQAEAVRQAELEVENRQAGLARADQHLAKEGLSTKERKEWSSWRNATQIKLTSAQKQLAELRDQPKPVGGYGNVQSSFYAQAKALSGKSENGYWTRPTEMFARAFESFVFDQLEASDYLVHGVEADRYADSARYKGNPYPTGAEREAINRAFGELIRALQTRETEKGLQLYSDFDRDQQVSAYNQEANRQIDQWAAGKLKSSAIIELGHPSSVLLRFGMPDLPMHLTQAVLRKAVREKHDVDVSDLKDLAMNVQAPIAVFGSKRGPGHLVVVTEARHTDGNVVVALDLDVKRDGIGINDVRSIHPKRDSSVTRWIEEGFLLGVEKRKGRDWLENSVGSNFQQPQVKAALDNSTIYDTDSIRNQQPSDLDAQMFGAITYGTTVDSILKAIAQRSASAFNRELATLLQAQALKTTLAVTPDDGRGAGSYNPVTDAIEIHGVARTEQVVLHELMHAATVKALTGKSVAGGAMRALMKTVRKELGIDAHYGLTTVYEFVAEAFTNPEFQQALKGIQVKPATLRGKLTDAWLRFVSSVRQLLGLDPAQETALGRALELGVRLMKENPTATFEHPLTGKLYSKADETDHLTVKDWIGHQLANHRGWALGALTRDQLADTYGKQMPEVADFDRVVQQMDQARNIVAEQADEIIERWRKLPAKTADTLAGIMHSATLEQFDPDTRTDVATPEQSILLKDWKALSPEAQQLYRDVRDQYAATLAKLRNGLSRRAERAGAAGQRIAAEIRLQFDKYLAEGPYFPLARFGDFILIADKHEQRIVEAFESSAAREKRARQLRITGWKTKLTAKKAYSAMKDGPAGEFVGDVLKLVDGLEIEAKEKASLMDSLNQLAISALPDQSYRRHFTHRKGTAGFSQDAMRAFASSMQHVAHHVARVLHGDELTLLLDSMNKRISETTGDVDTTVQQQVANELAKRLDLMLNPNTHPVTALAGQVGFVMSLGGSVASGLTNLSQTPLITFPWLGARFGFDKAAGALTKASKDYFGGKWDKWSGFVLKDNKSLSAGEQRALQQLEDAGLINLTQTSDLASTATADSAASGRSWAINRAMKIIGWTFSVPEVFNRQVSALAAYRLATEKGQSHDEAVQTALETLRRTHFDYSASNRARWMAGNFTRVVTMFKQYSQQMTYLLWRNAYQALKAESPEVRREARRMLLGVAAMHFSAAGALGLPLGVFGISPLLGLLSMGMGSGDDPWDWEVELRKMLADTFGKAGGEAIAHGPLRLLTNVDFASRVGLGDLWVRSPQGDKEGRDLVEAWMLTLLGPVAGYVGNLGTAAKALDEGKYGRGLESMLPKMLAAPLKAARYESEGVKSWRGDDLGVTLSGGDILGTALGFNPSKVAEMHEGRSAIKGREAKLTARREELTNMWMAATLAGDTEMQAEAMGAAMRFNQANPSMAISADSLRRSMQAKLRNQAMIKDGVYLQRRREDLRAEGRFANVE